MSDPEVTTGPDAELPTEPPGELVMADETGQFSYVDDESAPIEPPVYSITSVEQGDDPGLYMLGTELYRAEVSGLPEVSNLEKWKALKPRIWADGSSELIVVADDTINTPDYTAADLWIRRVGTALGGTVTNKGNGGRMRLDVVLALLTPGTSAFVPGSADLVTQSAGGNDFGRAHATEVGRRAFKNQTSALLGIYRHKSKVLPGSQETGTWVQSEKQYSGKTRKTTTRGATQTIRFTGTGATLMMLGYTDLVTATSFAGSEFTWSLDGSAPVSRSTKRQGIIGSDKAPHSVLPIHFRDLPDTEHTIVITHTGSAGDPLIVDSVFVWQKRVQDMPFVLMMPPAKTTARGALLYPEPRPTDAANEVIRQLQEDVFDEFGRDGTFGGIPGTILDRWYPPLESQVLGDGLHPDNSGHLALKEAALEGLALYAPTSYLVDAEIPDPEPEPDPEPDPDPVVTITMVAPTSGAYAADPTVFAWKVEPAALVSTATLYIGAKRIGEGERIGDAWILQVALASFPDGEDHEWSVRVVSGDKTVISESWTIRRPTIIVSPPAATGPDVVITNPTEGAVVPDFLELSATASDASSAVISVAARTLDGQLLARLDPLNAAAGTWITRIPRSVLLAALDEGSNVLAFTLRATNGRYFWTDTPTRTITVAPEPEPEPVEQFTGTVILTLPTGGYVDAAGRGVSNGRYTITHRSTFLNGTKIVTQKPTVLDIEDGFWLLDDEPVTEIPFEVSPEFVGFKTELTFPGATPEEGLYRLPPIIPADRRIDVTTLVRSGPAGAAEPIQYLPSAAQAERARDEARTYRDEAREAAEQAGGSTFTVSTTDGVITITTTSGDSSVSESDGVITITTGA